MAAAMVEGQRVNRTQVRRTNVTKLVGTINYYANALKDYVSPIFQGRVSGVFGLNTWIFVDWEKSGFCCFYICSHFIV